MPRARRRRCSTSPRCTAARASTSAGVLSASKLRMRKSSVWGGITLLRGSARANPRHKKSRQVRWRLSWVSRFTRSDRSRPFLRLRLRKRVIPEVETVGRGHRGALISQLRAVSPSLCGAFRPRRRRDAGAGRPLPACQSRRAELASVLPGTRQDAIPGARRRTSLCADGPGKDTRELNAPARASRWPPVWLHRGRPSAHRDRSVVGAPKNRVATPRLTLAALRVTAAFAPRKSFSRPSAHTDVRRRAPGMGFPACLEKDLRGANAASQNVSGQSEPRPGARVG